MRRALRFRPRHAVGIGLAVTVAAAATLVLSLATASAQPSRGPTETGVRDSAGGVYWTVEPHAAATHRTRTRKASKPGALPRLGSIITRRLPPFIAYSYESEDGAVAGISLVKPDGSESHLIGHALPNGTQEPSWSPRGTKILFQSGCSIWVMNADGSNQRSLIPAGRCVGYGRETPHWGPKGKRIIYTVGMIRIANADGSHVHRVPHTEGAENASFSPDGRYIVFDKGGPFKPHIYVLRPNGTGLQVISTGHFAEDPSWSPDGKRLIYSCSIYTNPFSPPPGSVAPIGIAPFPSPHAICEVSRTHPKPRTLYSVPSGDAIGGQTWSADGKTILVQNVNQKIALLSPSGGTPIEITLTGYQWDADW